jgi:hypothetical protein
MKVQTENFTPRGQNSPLGDNFAPEVKVLLKLRMGLCTLGKK